MKTSNVLMKIQMKIQTEIGRINAALDRFINGSHGLAGDTEAEAYVGEAVKILIAVVVGALLLTLTYALMKDTVFKTVTQKVTELFNYKS